MKQLLQILLFLLPTTIAAQDISLAPDSVFVEGPATNQPLLAFADISNHTNTSKVVIWKRLFEDIPAGWDSGVCTSLGCFLSDVSEGEFPMIPLESLGVDLQFETNGIPGNGRVEVKMYFENDSTDFVIGVYEASATSVNAEELLANDKIKVYPNPANDCIYMESENVEISRLDVFDMFGKLVYSKQDMPEKLETQSWKEGIYVIRFSASEYTVAKKVIVRK